MLGEHPVGEQPKLGSTLQRVLSTVPPKEYRRQSVEDKDNQLNYFYVSNGFGRMVGCVATADVRMRTVFAYLEAVEPLIRGMPYQPENEENSKQFREIIQQKMEFYNDPRNDKITALNNDIKKAVDMMVDIPIDGNMDNMNKVLAEMDDLHAKNTTLAVQGNVFQQQTENLMRQLCLRNAKLTIMIVLVVIFIILMIVREPNFSQCS